MKDDTMTNDVVMDIMDYNYNYDYNNDYNYSSNEDQWSGIMHDDMELLILRWPDTTCFNYEKIDKRDCGPCRNHPGYRFHLLEMFHLNKGASFK